MSERYSGIVHNDSQQPRRMNSFDTRMASAVDRPGPKGWLVAILELGAWVGVLMTGKVLVKPRIHLIQLIGPTKVILPISYPENILLS